MMSLLENTASQHSCNCQRFHYLMTNRITIYCYQAWQFYEEGKLLELVDPEMGDFPEKEVLKYIKVALFCTQENANRRPMMSQVLDMLTKNIKLNEKELTPPGFFQDSGGFNSSQLKLKSSESSTSHQMSSVPLSITQVTPR